MRAAQISAGAIAKVVLVAALVIGGLYFVYLIREVLGLLLIALFFALAVAPPVDWLDHKGVPRWLAIVIVYVMIGAGIFGIGLLMVPPLVDGVEGLSEDIPGYIDDLRENESFRDFDDQYNVTESIEDQAGELPSQLGDAAGTLRDVTVGVFSSFVQLFLILVIGFFLLMEGSKLLDFIYRQLPEQREKRVRGLGDDISAAVSGYVFGAFTIALLAGIVTYATLELLGVPFALPLALTFAFFDLVPLVGATIGGILVGIVVALTSFPVGLIIWVVVLLVYQQVENNLIAPYVYGQAVRVHPLGILVAILIGASLLGILGALVAIPASAAVQALIRDYWAYSERNLAKLAKQAAAAVDPDEEEREIPGAVS